MQRYAINKLFLVLFAFIYTFVFVAPCAGEPVVKDNRYTVLHLKTYQGNNKKRQKSATPFQRIISLSPAITEALYLLGVKDRIIGVTTYCRKPPDAVKKEKTGTIMETNTEKVISLKPDLVIGTELTNSKDIKKLKNTGVNVVTFNISKDFNGLCQFFLELGRLLGKEEQARNMIEASKKKIVQTQIKVKELPGKKVFVQLGSKPLFAATKDFFINDLIEFAGGVNIFKDARSGLVSREEVVHKNPDIIIITTMGITGKKEQKSWRQYRTVNAAKNNRIYLVDSDSMCSPTPVSFAIVLEEIVKILHPEVTDNPAASGRGIRDKTGKNFRGNLQGISLHGLMG